MATKAKARSKETKNLDISPEVVQGSIKSLSEKDVAKIASMACMAKILGVDTEKAEPGTMEYSRMVCEGVNKYVSKVRDQGGNPFDSLIGDVTNLLLGGIVQSEMDSHLGYGRYERTSGKEKEAAAEGPSPAAAEGEATGAGGGVRKNCRNGSYPRKVRTKNGDLDFNFPRDRSGTFVSNVIPQGRIDISNKENAILELVARGNSSRDVANTINKIFGCDISHEYVKTVLDRYKEKLRVWQNREIQEFYPFIFIDCLYASIRDEQEVARKRPVYVILGLDITGRKELLDLRVVGNAESKQAWLNIFDQLQRRGLKDVLFVCLDGIAGVAGAIKAIFQKARTQRCIVHMVRNSCKTIASKYKKEFCNDVKMLYSSNSVEEGREALNYLEEKWSGISSYGVKFWKKNFEEHVAPLYKFPTAVRKVIYTTNAIESTNSSLRLCIRKGTYTSSESVLALMHLRSEKVLETNWKRKPVRNWPQIVEQLLNHEETEETMRKYMK